MTEYVSANKNTEAKAVMDLLKSFMFSDIKVAIDGGANYLAALALSTYTEYLGGLLSGTLTSHLGQNYTKFIQKYFDSEYMVLDSRLRKDGFNGLYEAVRSGLVHEYFMKAKGGVSAVATGSPIPLKWACLRSYQDTKTSICC